MVNLQDIVEKFEKYKGKIETAKIYSVSGVSVLRMEYDKKTVCTIKSGLYNGDEIFKLVFESPFSNPKGLRIVPDGEGRLFAPFYPEYRDRTIYSIYNAVNDSIRIYDDDFKYKNTLSRGIADLKDALQSNNITIHYYNNNKNIDRRAYLTVSFKNTVFCEVGEIKDYQNPDKLTFLLTNYSENRSSLFTTVDGVVEEIKHILSLLKKKLTSLESESSEKLYKEALSQLKDYSSCSNKTEIDKLATALIDEGWDLYNYTSGKITVRCGTSENMLVIEAYMVNRGMIEVINYEENYRELFVTVKDAFNYIDKKLKDKQLRCTSSDSMYLAAPRRSGKTAIVERMLKTMKSKNEIKNVIFSDPATIVFWDDDTKTVVKTQNGEAFDPEKGLAMAIVKKVFGNNKGYYKLFLKWVGKYKRALEKEAKKKAKEEEIRANTPIVKSPDEIVYKGASYVLSSHSAVENLETSDKVIKPYCDVAITQEGDKSNEQ